MTSPSLNQASPVAKTAFDSIQAKKSALSVGYDTMVVDQAERYNELLEAMTTDLKMKRQTPLVNIGYACRVRAASHSINAFVRYHRHANPSNKKIQIVFLGCGMDILGLWSRSLVPQDKSLRIVELDMPSVCTVKKELLEQFHLVSFHDSNENKGYTGIIEPQNENSCQDYDYVLWPVDLTVSTQLDDIMLQDGMLLDPSNIPTLVISEVVLSYLGPTASDQLLKWCSSNLIRTNGSAFVALEPLGIGNVNSTHHIISVWEGYRREYCQRFHEKMERGNAASSSSTQGGGVQRDSPGMASSFHPIGTSSESLKSLVRTAGYGRVHVQDMGSAAAHADSTSSFQIAEIFDEQSALVLHLQSYQVITAFMSDVDGTFERLLCPASYASLEIPPILGDDGIFYTTIQPQYEEPMKEMFRKSYEELTSTHPSVRKMIHGILNREFALSLDGATESSIAVRYSQQGGCFFIAAKYSNDGSDRRSVVGCVGVRFSEREDACGNMEIFRLAVDETFRRMGIGRQLLQIAETYARSRKTTKIFASTITNLKSALLLYEACGYELEGDIPLGSLTLRTYSKSLR